VRVESDLVLLVMVCIIKPLDVRTVGIASLHDFVLMAWDNI
jgi:hypothetical protein